MFRDEGWWRYIATVFLEISRGHRLLVCKRKVSSLNQGTTLTSSLSLRRADFAVRSRGLWFSSYNVFFFVIKLTNFLSIIYSLHVFDCFRHLRIFLFGSIYVDTFLKNCQWRKIRNYRPVWRNKFISRVLTINCNRIRLLINPCKLKVIKWTVNIWIRFFKLVIYSLSFDLSCQ